MTQEQNEYIEKIVANNAVERIDATLVGAVRGAHNLRVEIPARRKTKPSLPPEADDMDLIPLPCCSTEMKTELGWMGETYCFYCGARVR